jgi:hypothetical protein
MLKQTILDSYVKVRNQMNPYIEPTNPVWCKYLRMNMEEFSIAVNKMPYRWDKLHGLIDETGDINTFWNKKDSDRDCDDTTRAWMTWGVNNGYHAQEVIISTEEHLVTKSHVITILNKDDEYVLCNYTAYVGFSSFSEALNYMKYFPSYKKGFIYSKGVKV